MTKLRDSVCIVTGAGSGIGRELAIQSSERGARRVIVTDVNQDGIRETCRIAESNGTKLESHLFDVGSSDQINKFVQAVLPTLRNDRLILINNAGMAICSGRFQDTSLEEFERLLDVNLLGLIRLTKGFYGYMLQCDEGHIVNLSSVFGLGGMDCQTAYCTSKFGVRGFTETLRMELAESNVNVTCVHPGGIKTNIVRNSSPSGPVIDQQQYEKLVQSFDTVARTSAEKAARQILDAVEKNCTRLVIGSDGKLFDWVTRLFPVRYTAIISRTYRKKFASPYAKNS